MLPKYVFGISWTAIRFLLSLFIPADQAAQNHSIRESWVLCIGSRLKRTRSAGNTPASPPSPRQSRVADMVQASRQRHRAKQHDQLPCVRSAERRSLYHTSRSEFRGVAGHPFFWRHVIRLHFGQTSEHFSAPKLETVERTWRVSLKGKSGI